MFKVIKKEKLLEFLYQQEMFPKKKMKSLLAHGNISVNGVVKTQFDIEVYPNDIVEIHFGKMISVKKGQVLPILYEDEDFIAIDKPCRLLSVATSRENSRTAYAMVREHVRCNNKNAKIYVLHRLDRETSGILVFAKKEQLKNKLQENWNKLVTLREYVALVEGTGMQDAGTLQNYLWENKVGKVVITKNREEGKLAITHYQKIKEVKDNTLLKINLETGRKNQIRVQLQNIGHPIVGDTKYGSKIKSIKRLGLHASKLEFIHPVTRKKYLFEAPIPRELER